MQLPWKMEKRLIKVKAVMEAIETVVVWMAGSLLFVHLSVPVKVGPSLLVGQNLKKMTGNGGCTSLNLMLLGMTLCRPNHLYLYISFHHIIKRMRCLLNHLVWLGYLDKHVLSVRVLVFIRMPLKRRGRPKTNFRFSTGWTISLLNTADLARSCKCSWDMMLMGVFDCVTAPLTTLWPDSCMPFWFPPDSRCDGHQG